MYVVEKTKIIVKLNYVINRQYLELKYLCGYLKHCNQALLETRAHTMQKKRHLLSIFLIHEQRSL